MGAVPASTAISPSIAHYENFPVASWLCPPALRQPIAAIYRFARTADDMADEGHFLATERMAALSHYREALDAAALDGQTSARWPQVFGPLATAIREFRLPVRHLHSLLDAFEQDVRYTNESHLYPDRNALLDYCSRSANPVGRLLLHLYEVDDEQARAESDAICTGLQLANFWQDLSVDIPRGRYYLPVRSCVRYGLQVREVPETYQQDEAKQLIHELTDWALQTLEEGENLPSRIPGRAGWELRLVWQGGRRITERVRSLGPRAWRVRPTIGPLDALHILLRGAVM